LLPRAPVEGQRDDAIIERLVGTATVAGVRKPFPHLRLSIARHHVASRLRLSADVRAPFALSVHFVVGLRNPLFLRIF